MKNRIILISIFLIIWSFIIASPFQKGGVDQIFHYIIFSIFLAISFVYLSTIESFIMAEKILYSLLFSFIALSTSLLFTGKILEKIYGFDYEMYQSNQIANLIFYLLTNGILIIIIFLIRKVKNQK